MTIQYFKDGEQVTGDVTFIVEGEAYLVPHDNLYLWTEAELTAIGVTTQDIPDAPPVVSSAQAKLALYEAGLLDAVTIAVANHPYRPVRIWFEAANVWEPTNPYINGIGLELGLTDEQIVALFRAAALK